MIWTNLVEEDFVVLAWEKLHRARVASWEVGGESAGARLETQVEGHQDKPPSGAVLRRLNTSRTSSQL